MEWWPFLIFHRGGLRIKVINNTNTHSRPYVSNDNPYSESQFKTMKYCPQFPSRFGSAEDGRLFCCGFFDYYNFHLSLP